jgi:solute carrier family 25, member 38
LADAALLGADGRAVKSEAKGMSSSSLPKLSTLANLTTGAIARASVGFLVMPITVIKVRYESNIYSYKSLFGAAGDIFRNEGFKGFFSGFGATAIRDAPYAGLYVLFYEESKKRLALLVDKAPIPVVGTAGQGSDAHEEVKRMKAGTSAGINFVSGIMAAATATAITNPFDAVKTRIQLMPAQYSNTIHAVTKMIREDGVRSLMDGLGLRMARKAMSSALAWTLYEELIRRAEVKLEEKNAVL